MCLENISQQIFFIQSQITLKIEFVLHKTKEEINKRSQKRKILTLVPETKQTVFSPLLNKSWTIGIIQSNKKTVIIEYLQRLLLKVT